MMEAHEIAKIMPSMGEEQFQALKADVEACGILTPIWVYEGKILDGRHRYRAAHELGIACPTQEYAGTDPIGFVLSLNLTRRHLDASQRALIAAKIARLKHGGDRKSDQGANLPLDPTVTQAAQSLNVSPRTVKTARKVLAKAAPEVVAAVESGEVAVSAAAKVADLPKDEQAAALVAPPATKDVPKKKAPAAVEKLQARVAELEAERDDLVDRLKTMAAELEKEMAANAILTADDQVKAAMETIAERDRTIADLESRMNGLMNEKNAAIRQVKALQRKAK